jgi:hypothetical protein
MREGKRIQRFDDIPGSATIIPITIDITAASTDKRIVAPKPFSKKRILFAPFFVDGSMTYQPQLPLDVQPASTRSDVINIVVRNFMSLPLML